MNETLKPTNPYIMPASIIFSALLITGAIFYSSTRDGASNTATVGDVADVRPPANVPLFDSNDPMIGDPNAPVTVVEFSDFQCPFCKRYFDDAGRQIMNQYVKTGKVRLIYRDFPLDQIHPRARPAAEAAECANMQGKFWVFHDMLFERQDTLPSSDFVALAGELGLNTTQFKKCVESHQFAAEVEEDYQAGIALGVNGTPATFIDGVPISGAQPFAVFKSAIDKAISKSK